MVDHEQGAGAGAPNLAAWLPVEPPEPDPAAVDDRSRSSMVAYLDALARRRAWVCARRAVEIQAGDAGFESRHSSAHGAIVSALAAAETRAPAAERSVYASMLDAYAAAYGLKGWYRCTNDRGEHQVQVNRIRTAAEGDRGRYFVVRGAFWADEPYWVVDRDTGRTAYRAETPAAAQEWLEAAETAPAGG